jgi:hypothetical protein
MMRIAGMGLAAVTLALGAMAVGVACNTADIHVPPPIDSGDLDCASGAEPECDAATSGPGCMGNPDAGDDAIAQIPTQLYPVGCEVKIHNPHPDTAGDCFFVACTCAANSDGGAEGVWGCTAH